MKRTLLLLFITAIPAVVYPQGQVLSTQKNLMEIRDANRPGVVLFHSAHSPKPANKDIHLIHALTLEINKDILLSEAKNFRIRLHLKLAFSNRDSSGHEEKDLTVNYTGSGPYQAKDGFEKAGFEIVDYEVTQFSMLDDNGTPVAITQTNKNNATLTQHLQFDRYPDPQPGDGIKLQYIKISNDKGYASFSWHPVDWALAYDIEYSFVNNYSSIPGVPVPAASASYNFRFNNTRVQLKDTLYEIPLIYESGFLVFRVRPVGYAGKNFDKIVTGQWSVAADAGTPVTAGGTEGHFFCSIDKNANVHENDLKNWQYIAQFAEEGKRKDVVDYLDGTLRSRQKVSSLNTQNSLLVNETVYDNAGRAAIQVLPTPMIPSHFPNEHAIAFGYQPGLNQDTGRHPYSWADFDTDRTCLPYPAPISNTSGAGKYYSSANDFINATVAGPKRQMAFVADAEGFPFVQTEYIADNSGRVKRQSAPGKTFSFGSGQKETHEQYFYYDSPSQEELDRVFGNDIGFASHYSKETKIDENGQASVTYKNLQGKIVATALAGLHPPNLTPLDEQVNKKKITTDLAFEHTHIDYANQSIITFFPLVVPENTSLDLNDSMLQNGFTDTVCTAAMKVCYECVYDLSIVVKDDCGKTLWKVQKQVGSSKKPRECENEGKRVHTDTTLALTPGSYTIYKTLTVNDSAINTFISDYISDTCWNIPPKPVDPALCFIQKCDIKTVYLSEGCDTVPGAPSIWSPKIERLPQPQPLPHQPDQPVAIDCFESTGKDLLSISVKKMMADLSPGGQYAGYGAASDPLATIYAYPLSVLNETNQLPSSGNWKHPVFPYRHRNGEQIFVTKNDNGVIKKLLPEELSLKEFIENWDPAMAYSLLPYHPEYCYYDWTARHQDYFDYETTMGYVDSYKKAYEKYPIIVKPLFISPDSVNDQFFKDHRDLIPAMVNYMKDISKLRTETGYTSMKMADLAAVSAAGFSSSVTAPEAEQYFTFHQLFSDNSYIALEDQEWKQYRFYYLQARKKLIEAQRLKEIIHAGAPQCCMLNDYINNPACKGLQDQNLCALFSSKTPDFPSLDRVDSLIANGGVKLPPAGTDLSCVNCAQPQGYVLYLNTLLAAQKLFTPMRIFGQELAPIANHITDSILLGGGHVSWIPVKTVAGLDASLINDRDSSTICNIRLSSASGSIDWNKIDNFSCLKNPGTVSGQFNLIAWDTNVVSIPMTGSSDCFTVTQCARTDDYVPSSRDKEYSVMFIEMLEKLLNSVSAGTIATSLVTGRNPQSPAYPKDNDPVHLWHITSGTAVGNNFSIPVNFSEVSPAPLYSIDIKSARNIFTTFQDWRITSHEFNAVKGTKDTCVDAFTAKIYVQRRNQLQTVDSFEVSFNLPVGTSCEFNRADLFCCLPPTSRLPVPVLPDCITIQQTQAANNAEIRMDSLKKVLSARLRAGYLEHCLHPVEKFIATYYQRLYHYTLYYYDQAGNLIKTVAPFGVDTLTDAVLAQSLAIRKVKKDTAVLPVHKMITASNFNSLNNLVWTRSPDAGATRFSYDELGRLIYKQNANQSAVHALKSACFTFYDSLGRVTQTGQIPVSYNILPSHLPYEDFTIELADANTAKEDVITTFYDCTPSGVKGNFDFDLTSLHQRNLRNRISATIYHRSFMDNTKYTHAFFYSYDIDGNLDTLVQDFRLLDYYESRLNFCGSNLFHRLKKIVYDYDLISKKTNRMHYQPGKPDEFIHYYEYDADNRLIKTKTSTRTWEQPSAIDADMSYQYYLHGPLARIELGQEKIQGLDYSYTLQGRIKAVNSTIDIAGRDPGRDDGTDFLKDAFAWSLNYFTGDYTQIGGDVFTPVVAGSKMELGFSKPQFNGNISNKITMLDAFIGADKIQATGLNYDQLDRIMGMQVFQPAINQPGKWSDGRYTEGYHTTYSYNADGGIQTLLRKNAAGTIIDDLCYQYHDGRHQADTILNSASIVATRDLQLNNFLAYDAGGRLINQQESPDPAVSMDFSWSAFDKVRNVSKDGYNLEFAYNASMERGLKYEERTKTASYYVRDLQGNSVAIYRFSPTEKLLAELPIYGSNRVGSFGIGLDLSGKPNPGQLQFFRGKKEYELAGNTGNILATVSDRRIPTSSGWATDIKSTQDYYSYGALMRDRKIQGSYYRYGITGKESDKEINDTSNTYDFGARMYNPRIGLWYSVDPSAQKYPGWSPYNYCLNNPLILTDRNGTDPDKVNEPNIGEVYTKKTFESKTTVTSLGGELTNQVSTTMKIGQEGKIGTYTVNEDIVGKQKFEATLGPFTVEEDKLTMKSTAFSVSVSKGLEVEVKAQMGLYYAGFKSVPAVSVEGYIGMKTKLNTNLTLDVRNSFKSGTPQGAPKAVVIPTGFKASMPDFLPKPVEAF